jgi:hypothetical protein
MVEGDMAGRRACAGRDARLGLYPVASVTIYTAILERLASFMITPVRCGSLVSRRAAVLDRPGTNKIKLQNASMG